MKNKTADPLIDLDLEYWDYDAIDGQPAWIGAYICGVKSVTIQAENIQKMVMFLGWLTDEIDTREKERRRRHLSRMPFPTGIEMQRIDGDMIVRFRKWKGVGLACQDEKALLQFFGVILDKVFDKQNKAKQQKTEALPLVRSYARQNIQEMLDRNQTPEDDKRILLTLVDCMDDDAILAMDEEGADKDAIMVDQIRKHWGDIQERIAKEQKL